MTHFLVDSNVILDVLTEDSHWFDGSAAQLADCAESGFKNSLPLPMGWSCLGWGNYLGNGVKPK